MCSEAPHGGGAMGEVKEQLTQQRWTDVQDVPPRHKAQAWIVNRKPPDDERKDETKVIVYEMGSETCILVRKWGARRGGPAVLPRVGIDTSPSPRRSPTHERRRRRRDGRQRREG